MFKTYTETVNLSIEGMKSFKKCENFKKITFCKPTVVKKMKSIANTQFI